MDVALVNFIGSGMIAASSGLGIVLPNGAARDGYSFIDYLSRDRAPALKDLLEGLIADIWSSWQTAGIPHAVALQHLEKLPSIIEANAPSMGYFVSGFAKSITSGPGDAAGSAAAGRAITAETIMQARETNIFEKEKLNEDLCFFFLERLFVRLLSRPGLFDDLKPAVEAYLAQKPWLGARADEPLRRTLAPRGSALPASCRDKMENGGGRTVENAARHKAQPAGRASDAALDSYQIDASSDVAQLQTSAQRYRALSVLAAHKGDRMTQSRLQLLLGRVLYRLGLLTHDGTALDEAAGLLSTALEHLHGALPSAPAASAGDNSEASGSGERAQPDKVDRAELNAAQMVLGDLLWHLSSERDDVGLASQAVDIYETLCARLRKDDDALLRIKAHCALGSIYIALAKTGEDANSLAKAASAFEAAAEATAKLDNPLQWATVTSQLASVYGATALNSGDHEVMVQAIEMKLAALDVLESEGAEEGAERLRDELYHLQVDVQRLIDTACSGATSATINPLLMGQKAAMMAR